MPVTVNPTAGFYKVGPGLDRFRASLPLAAAGQGGIDVIGVGDSIMVGYQATLPTWDGPMHIAKLALQARYNPAGVTGGYGYENVPGVTGDNAAYDSGWTFDTNANPSSLLMGRIWTTTAGTRVRYTFDGTSAASRRQSLTSVDYVLTKNVSRGTMQYDVSSGSAYVTPGTGALGSGTVNLNAASQDQGIRSGANIATSSLTPGSVYSVQFSTAGTTRVDQQGVIAYNGDENCGVRVQNISVGGMSALQFVSDPQNQSMVSKFTGGGYGATKGKLAVCDFITNDQFQSSDVPTFKANMQAIATYLTGLGMSLVFLIPPKPSDTGTYASTFTNYASYVAAIYQVCDATAHTCVVDLWKMLGNTEWSVWTPSYAWTNADGVHYNTAGYLAFGTYLAQAITLGKIPGSSELTGGMNN